VVDIAGPNNTRIPRWPLAAARIYLGVVFYLATILHLINHANTMAHDVAVIHIVLGLALIVGLLTRITGAVAVLLLCNYMAASGTKPFSPGPAAAFAALALVVSLGNAGLLWGLDGTIDRRWSHMVPR